jgi:hypothetical protein
MEPVAQYDSAKLPIFSTICGGALRWRSKELAESKQ